MNTRLLSSQERIAWPSRFKASVTLLEQGLQHLRQQDAQDLRPVTILHCLADGFQNLFIAISALLGQPGAGGDATHTENEGSENALVAMHDALVRVAYAEVPKRIRQRAHVSGSRYLLMHHQAWRALLQALALVQTYPAHSGTAHAGTTTQASNADEYKRLFLALLEAAHPSFDHRFDRQQLFVREASLQLVEAVETAICAFQSMLTHAPRAKERRQQFPELANFVRKIRQADRYQCLG